MKPLQPNLTACLTVWNAAEQALQKASRLAGVNLDVAPTNQVRPAEMIARLRDHLQAIKKHMEIRDYVAVADAVETDMPGLTDGWQRMLVGLQQDLLAQA
jgi:hypothetical protein